MEDKVLLLRDNCHLIVDTLRLVEEMEVPLGDLSSTFSSLELKTLVIEYIYETQSRFAAQLSISANSDILAEKICMRNERITLSGSWPLRFYGEGTDGSAINLDVKFVNDLNTHSKDMDIRSKEMSSLEMNFETFLNNLTREESIYWVGKYESRYYLVVEEKTDNDYNIIWVAIYQ